MSNVKPSMRGLNAALAPNTVDPLGIDVKRRGMDAYYAEAKKSDPNYMSGPLPDPEWEGYFQSLADAGVTKVGQDVARPQGLADDPAWQTQGDIGGLSGTGNTIADQPLMKSNSIARPSMRGLLKARRG